jgi:hypothetical protein
MMFGWFRKKERVGGKIAYFGLSEWWLLDFAVDERALIRKTYMPLGTGDQGIDTGVITFTSQTTLSFLSNVAGWFNKEETRHIAYKFLLKADEFSQGDMSIMSKHFAMQSRCETFYKWRELDDLAVQEAINACERGISFSREAAAAFQAEWGDVPSHYCFKQLAIIEEKRGNLDRALELCRRAREDGWKGDWEARIARLERKKAKLR